MSELYLNADYKAKLSLRETEHAIKMIKDFFQDHLAEKLSLQRVSAPLFVRTGSGVNDDLNGIERKVSFEIRDDGSNAEVVFSLADARDKIEQWRDDYNHHRPHSSLGDLSPVEFAKSCIPSASPTAQWKEYNRAI